MLSDAGRATTACSSRDILPKSVAVLAALHPWTETGGDVDPRDATEGMVGSGLRGEPITALGEWTTTVEGAGMKTGHGAGMDFVEVEIAEMETAEVGIVEPEMEGAEMEAEGACAEEKEATVPECGQLATAAVAVAVAAIAAIAPNRESAAGAGAEAVAQRLPHAREETLAVAARRELQRCVYKYMLCIGC